MPRYTGRLQYVCPSFIMTMMASGFEGQNNGQTQNSKELSASSFTPALQQGFVLLCGSMLTVPRFRRQFIHQPRWRRGFHTSPKRTVFSFIHSDCSPCRRLPYFNMFYTRCFGPFTFAISLASIPARFTNFIASDPAHHSPCIPRGHPSLRPTFGLGGLDCVGLHDFDYVERGGNMRHEENPCEPKGAEEENSAEC